MARPDKSYLEKQTSRRNAPKKKKLGEGVTDSRFAKISFKNYLRQIEEELLDEFVDDQDDDEDEGGDETYKFIVVTEGHWDNPEDNSSMLDIHEVTEDELRDHGINHIEELYEDEDLLADFCEALEHDNVGKIIGKGRVHNPNPDMGQDGVVGPDGVELLFPPL